MGTGRRDDGRERMVKCEPNTAINLCENDITRCFECKIKM